MTENVTRVNRANAPYYDDYDSAKQYTHLLAVPGRAAQAREFTQIQSTVKDIIKNIGDSIMKDGNVIEGCQVIINNEKTEATITAGKVYLNGMVLPVKETTIAIDGVKEGVIGHTETIGFKLKESIVTEEDDEKLRDPAQGYENNNQPGCHRIKSEVIIVKDEADSSILSSLIDGEIAVENYAPEYDTLTQTLARRTHDESGSYIVDGLNVRVEANNLYPDKFNVVVESGKAYVLGYEIKIPAPRRIPVSRSTDTSLVTDVPVKYPPVAPLSSAPYIKEITRVTGTVSKTVSQTISSNTDSVLIDETQGVSITEVSQGDTVFEEGTDYTLTIPAGTSRYHLKWLGTDNYPVLNSSYTVEYTYSHTFINNKDYELIHNEETDAQELHWIDGEDKPIENTTTLVSYNVYLARKDIVYIDQYGEISVLEGTPAENGFELLPDAPVNTLALASISSPPGGDTSSNMNLKILSSNIGLTRFTMNDIQALLNRIRTIEYDQSILSLNEEARNHDTPNKRGIFTDPLIDLSKVDYYYDLSDIKYDVTIDLIDNLCYLPVRSNTYDAVYNESSSSHKYARTVTLSKTGERVVLSQLNATKSFLINPYSMFPQYPEISISPAVDTWIEDSIIEVPVSQSASEVVSASTRHIENYNTRGARRADTVTSTSSTTAIGTRVDVSSTESVIEERAIKYIRSREIEVEGSQFLGGLKNIKCYFDGTLIESLTPTGNTTSGDEPYSINADEYGKFTAKFTIPKDKILTGIREVRFESNTITEGYTNSAFALYQAAGTSRTIQRTVTTLTTVLLTRVTTVTTTHNIDPVGQTFVLDKMTLVSGIDLYFEGKPEGTTPVTCDIREVVNGTITSTIYGHKTLSAADVKVSSDGREATRFTFDDPVLLEENKEYAFVVRSTSPSYRIWVADLGGTDILTGNPVLSNPYLIGVMMSSSNNSSWTMHQTTDIKFRLIEDVYNDQSEVLFNEIVDIEEFSRIYLLAESVIPNGTSIDWAYSVDSGVTWRNISPYILSIRYDMHKNILLKANLKRESAFNLSPILALDSVGVGLSNYDTETGGYYISRNITGLDAYTNVSVILDSYIPSGTGLEVYVSNGVDFKPAELDETSVRGLNYEWREQTYKATVSSSNQCRIFIKMRSNYKYSTPSFRRLRVIMS